MFELVIENKTGKIIALVGGKDYEKSQFNRALYSKRQVGSTMKPYLYYAALENGFTTSTSFYSSETTFALDNNKTYSPKNYNDKYGNKAISMAAATAYSDNIYAVKTHMFLGNETLVNLARRVGITEKLEAVPSLPLGTNEINIIQMAAGYASFANLGYKVDGHLIEKVIDGNGNILYERNNQKDLVLNSSLVFILNNMLTSTYDPLYVDYNYPTGISLNGKLKHTYSLKSGTTKGDNWNIGYNSKVVLASGEVLIDLTSDTVSASNLLQNYTAHGADGAPITGACTYDSDTSEDTLTVSEALIGKTFHARGTAYTGTMPNNGAVSGTITTKAQSYVIPQGYHDGSGTVSISSAEQAKIIATNIIDSIINAILTFDNLTKYRLYLNF